MLLQIDCCCSCLFTPSQQERSSKRRNKSFPQGHCCHLQYLLPCETHTTEKGYILFFTVQGSSVSCGAVLYRVEQERAKFSCHHPIAEGLTHRGSFWVHTEKWNTRKIFDKMVSNFIMQVFNKYKQSSLFGKHHSNRVSWRKAQNSGFRPPSFSESMGSWYCHSNNCGQQYQKIGLSNVGTIDLQ